MPEDARPDQPQPERADQSAKGSERPGDPRSGPEAPDDPRYHNPYWGPAPPYWDPYWGAPHYGWGHHWRHGWPPAPDFWLFEAMMRFAAGAAGVREQLWREMADAARHAQRDWGAPSAPYPYGPDPGPPPDPRHQDGREPPPHERRDELEASDAVDLKELRATLEAGKEEKLKKMRAAIEEAEASGSSRASPGHLETLRKALAHERSKAEAAIDTVIHDVKLARTAEAMRRKTWSRGAPPGRWR